MGNDYLEFIISAEPGLEEAVIAFLSEIEAIESFTEEKGYVHAFAKADALKAETVRNCLQENLPDIHFSIDAVLHAGKNWNEEWEKNYPPVEVGNFCQVIPGFLQPKPGFQYTVRIEPKMSFGTGHHNTTQLMIGWCAETDFKGKSMLDMGCGTGVLGILAMKLGVTSADFIDIDEICVENSLENIALNRDESTQNIPVTVEKGGAEIIKKGAYDIIFANIQRNVLIRDGLAYREALKPGGIIALSGFFDFDEELIASKYRELGFTPLQRKEAGGWMLLVFKLSEA